MALGTSGTDAGDRAPERSGPFVGTRILEITSTIAGQTAGMLLADLGADVLRVVEQPSLSETPDPGSLCWNRSKLCTVIDRAELATSAELSRLAGRADVVLTDVSPAQLGALSLGPERAFATGGAGIHAWMPPFAASGPFSELPGDPLLVEGLGGFAAHHQASEERPVSSVAPVISYVHGSLGAVAVAAALVGREEGGSDQQVVVSGLHAIGAALGTMMIDGLDLDQVFTVGKGLRAGPSFRLYKTGDGTWIFLGTLTPDIFFRALDVLGRMDVMVRDDVAGEFSNLLRPEVGAEVSAELEKTFAERPANEWLALFSAADVPAAPVSTRAAWMDSKVVQAIDGRLILDHPALGEVVMPGIPVALSKTPGLIEKLGDSQQVTPPGEVWSDAGDRSSVPRPHRPSGVLPLQGLRVIDMSTFLAAPTASALMADAGADVTRVEAPAGDPYRFYSLSYLSVNQRKRSIALDLRAPEGRRVLDDLITRADVLIDNLRPASLERLGIDDASLELLNPRLIRCSVSAFGQSSEMVQLPGFDPIMQALSGVAAAQGGDGEPVTIASPIFDILTGALTAFGALAAVLVRDRTGIAQKVSTSLAASTLVHAAELTFYAGRPPAARGGHDHPGPSPTHRYHRTADGWLAIAAKSDAEVDALLNVVGHPEWLGHPEEALSAELSSVFVTRQTAAWVDELGAASVPACPVLEREGALEDPILMANDFSHIVLDPDFGRIRLARSYADWVGGDAPPPARAQPLGHDTRAILSELGRSEAEIDELIEARIALSSG